ncbi:54S ribosomal protein subunit img1, mitochondrial [Trametes pubescens]|uniref:54S ribosomal protein subunit img1, mitochondrial n=1 Tax=Trametes pubescens TaxID=154538 RepID=A0A1M2VP27_TRAPU|nr:54S ribosomal protein subunit img1, mitochondrial [Trametes pubescens]
MFNSFRKCTQRLMSTATQPYPFSSVAMVSAPPPTPALEGLKAGKGLMPYLRQRLLSPEKLELLARFGRRHPERILPGSVLQVTSKHAPTAFTGVLLGIRRRGADTSVLLRNVINRTGVEVQFAVCSPNVKDVKVLMRAGGRGSEGRAGKRMRRAKLFYLRDSPDKMTAISAGMR